MSAAPPQAASNPPVVQQPSQKTLQLRQKLADFLRYCYKIWSRVPEQQRGLLATPAVLEECILAGTALHANEHGGVDMLWVKKDMPREALKEEGVGYWLAQAGPAPQLEQFELMSIREIPEDAVAEIRRTNDQNMIAHYYYAFIDFWMLILWHILIWLAGCLFYAFLMLANPTLIVGESSKLYRIFQDLSPAILFRPGLSGAALDNLLAGRLSLQQLRDLCVSLDTLEWEEYEMIGADYLQILGLPVLVHFGPLPHHVAIYIPKFDPYGVHHTPSLRNQTLELERCIRNIVELSLKIVKKAGPISQNSRKKTLQDLRQRIVQGIASSGLLDDLREAKRAMRAANKGFGGTRALGSLEGRTEEAYAASARAGQNAMAARYANSLKAVGAPKSEERRKSTIEHINHLRDELEDGVCTRLLACPNDLIHGTLAHARWEYVTPREGSDLVNAACGSNSWTGLDARQRQERLNRNMDSIANSVMNANTHKISPLEALRRLATPPKLRNGKLFLVYCVCPHCDQHWLINDKDHIGLHTCIPLRSQYIPALLTRRLEKLEENVAGAEAVKATHEPTKRQLGQIAGVTRCEVPVAFEWKVGDRLNGSEAIWANSYTPPQIKENRRPKLTDPLWQRVFDLRGRLSIRGLNRQLIIYPHQLLDIPVYAETFFDREEGTNDLILKEFEDIDIQTLADYANKADNLKAVKGNKQQKKAAQKADGVFIALHVPDTAEADNEAEMQEGEEDTEADDGKADPASAWALKQARALVKETAAIKQTSEWTMEQKRMAWEERIALDQLRILDYDFEEEKDLLTTVVPGHAKEAPADTDQDEEIIAGPTVDDFEGQEPVATDDAEFELIVDVPVEAEPSLPSLFDSIIPPRNDLSSSAMPSTNTSASAVESNRNVQTSGSSASTRRNQLGGPSIAEMLRSGRAAQPAPRLSGGLQRQKEE